MATAKHSAKSLAVHICEITGKLPGLNDYTLACRNNRYAGNKMKRDAQLQISWFLHPLPQIKRPVRIRFLWQEADHRRDPDNIAFAKKFILDTLVTLGKIPNDNMKYIKGFTDSFQISEKKDYRVEITIREVEDDGEP